MEKAKKKPEIEDEETKSSAMDNYNRLLHELEEAEKRLEELKS